MKWQNLKINKLFSTKKKNALTREEKHKKIRSYRLTYDRSYRSRLCSGQARWHFWLSSPFLGKVILIQIIFSQKSFLSYCVIRSTNLTFFKFTSEQVSEQIYGHFFSQLFHNRPGYGCGLWLSCQHYKRTENMWWNKCRTF